MRIKLDENLPTRLVSVLAELGHDVDTVPAERIAGRNDDVVWRAAQAGQRFLVTQDLDFSDIRKYTPGTCLELCLPPGDSTSQGSVDATALRKRDMRTIRNKRATGWPDDFNMRNYCEEQQLKALSDLR